MKLTAEEVRTLLHYNRETGDLTWLPRDPVNKWIKIWNGRFAGAKAGNLKSDGYVEVSIYARQYKAHRICWLIHHGEWPEIVDHINQIPSDNRIINLRSVDNATNLQNAPLYSTNKSGVNGVSWHKPSNKWVVSIAVGGKNKHLGLFSDLGEAAAARAAANIQYNYHPNHGVNPK